MADLDLSNVRVLTHSAVRIEAHDGTAIYFDPFQLAEEPHDASVALITHDHYDHFSPEDVAKVANERTVFVAPATCAEGVRDKLGLGEGRVIAARPGERLDVALPALPAAGGNVGTPATLAVEAVPAYNVQPDRLNFHPQANEWLGYVVAVGDVRYYVCGDTDQNPDNEARCLRRRHRPHRRHLHHGRGTGRCVRERAAPPGRRAHALRDRRGPQGRSGCVRPAGG